MKRSGALVVVLAAAVAAQEKAPSFPTTVEQVVVDVVVADRDGAPVGGLAREDFLLTEDGVPQRIAGFEPVHVAPPAPPPEPFEGRPRTASNVAAPGETAGRTFLLVFDDVHLTGAQGEVAKDVLAGFLRTRLGQGDRVLLVATSGGAWWAAPVEEREDLLAVLGRLQGRSVPDLSTERITDAEAYRIRELHDETTLKAVSQRYMAAGVLVDSRQDGSLPLADTMTTMVQQSAELTYRRASERVRSALATLEKAVAALEGTRGRKAVILVSPGFFYDPGVPEYRRILDAGRRANAAVYFLNAVGLEAMPAGLSAQIHSPLLLPRAGGLMPPEALRTSDIMGAHYGQMRDATAGADVIARSTGGLIVTDDVAKGLRRIADESRAYYLLGYVSTKAARDGKYRKIEVSLAPAAEGKARARGLEIRSREGYYAPLDGAPPPKAGPVDLELQRALDAPRETTGLPVRVATYSFEETTPGNVRCLIVAEVDVRTLAFREEEGRSLASLDVLFVAVNRETGQIVQHGQRADLRLLPATRERLAREWYPLRQEVELPAGIYQAKVVVREVGASRVGSVTQRLDIPDPRSFRITTPLVSDSLFAASLEAPRLPTAIARRDFAAGSRVYVALDVQGAKPDPATRNLRVSMGYEVIRLDGETLTRVEPRPIAPTPEGQLKRLVGFALEGAEAGEYRLEGEVEDEVTGKVLLFTEPFTVHASPGP